MIAGIVAGGAHRRSSGAGWTPADLNPQLWLDDRSEIVISGSDLTAWGNRGNLAGSFEQTSNAPAIIDIDGMRAVRFEGGHMSASAELLHLARGTSCAWVYAVYKKRSEDNYDTNRPILVGMTSDGGYQLGLSAGGVQSNGRNKPSAGGRRGTGGSYSGVNSTNPVFGSMLQAYGRLDFEAQQIAMRVNGSDSGSLYPAFDAAGNSTATPFGSLRLGYDLGSYGDVDVLAILAGNTRLTSESVQKLEGWAAHRYGLAASLPIDHPYKSAPPM